MNKLETDKLIARECKVIIFNEVTTIFSEVTQNQIMLAGIWTVLEEMLNTNEIKQVSYRAL